MIINDINFNDLYQQHLKACNHYNLPPTKWDKKAPKMAENLVGKPSRYNETLLKAMNVQPNETVLDIGCGPGTFVIPLAQQCQAVYALDYSQGMLDMVQQYKEKHQLNNITLLHKSWSDNWDDVPQADVILASRSTLVDDLDDMIEKLQSKAKKRVFLTSVTQRHFLDEGVFEAIGRDDVGFPTYIYLVNRLYQKGIHANVSFIETESGHFQGETFEDLLKDNVYLIDGDVSWSGVYYQNYKQHIIQFIKEHYGKNVKCEKIQTIDNVYIYKLTEDNEK